jgi:hypothetical protein
MDSPDFLQFVSALALLPLGLASAQSDWKALVTQSARDAVASSDPKTVSHGIDALAALGDQIPRIIAAYRKFKQQSSVRQSMASTLEKMQARADLAIPAVADALTFVADAHRKEEEEYAKTGIRGATFDDWEGFYYSVLKANGAKARNAVPALLEIFQSQKHDNTYLSAIDPAIAAIGLTSEAQVDTVVAAYTDVVDTYGIGTLDALRGIPPRLRGRAAQKFLPITSDQR